MVSRVTVEGQRDWGLMVLGSPGDPKAWRREEVDTRGGEALGNSRVSAEAWRQSHNRDNEQGRKFWKLRENT